MLSKRFGFAIAIVNCTFWPKNKVIGESLLELSKHNLKGHRACVVTQLENY